MKRILFLLLAASLLFSCKADTSKIEARIDALENVSIASLQAQMTQMSTTLGTLQSTQSQLSGYVSSLQTSVGTLESNYPSLQSAVTALQQKDQTFEINLQELQTAIGDSANDVKRWVESSYATLQQFNQVQTDITGIKTDIQTIFSRLDGLDQATQTIANNLRDATADLTSKLGKCQEDIAGILEDLEALQGDMDTVKEQIAAIISAVQSVVVVPDYRDGSVIMTNALKNNIRFEVYPLSAAENLASLGVSALSLDYVETETKSETLTNIPITLVSFDGEFLKVNANGTGLKETVMNGTSSANARLRISDGAIVKSSEYFPLTMKTLNGAVDLGLSVLWASCNLGASAPEEYGDYYAWGETETKSGYFWSNYKFGKSETGPFSKYNTISSCGTVDDKTVLDLEDDVAYVTLGGKWRMPVNADFQELIDNCDADLVTLSGVSGYKFTSKETGKWIFFPMAGEFSGSSTWLDGYRGRYWTASLRVNNPNHADDFYFDSSGVGVGGYYRYCGRSIRPVWEY